MLKEFLALLPLVVQLLPLVGQQQEEVVEMKKAIQQIADRKFFTTIIILPFQLQFGYAESKES